MRRLFTGLNFHGCTPCVQIVTAMAIVSLKAIPLFAAPIPSAMKTFLFQNSLSAVRNISFLSSLLFAV